MQTGDTPRAPTPETAPFGGGFDHPPVAAARAFRAAMTAMARPGEIVTLPGVTPPAPLSPAAGALLLTLVDGDVALHLAGAWDDPALRDWLAFHTGVRLTAAEAADFAIGRWADLLPLERFRIGTPEYPDRSATLIVELEALRPGGVALAGPGIAEVAHLPLPDPAILARNAALFPQGIDCFFTAGDRAAALPRSTRQAGG